jgi:hypothetical protein
MSFGLGVFRSNGALAFSSDDVTWNQVDMLYCPGGSTTNRTYSMLAGREVLAVQVMIDPPPLNRRAIAHTVSVSGNNVTVSGGSEAAYVIILMR